MVNFLRGLLTNPRHATGASTYPVEPSSPPITVNCRLTHKYMAWMAKIPTAIIGNPFNSINLEREFGTIMMASAGFTTALSDHHNFR